MQKLIKSLIAGVVTLLLGFILITFMGHFASNSVKKMGDRLVDNNQARQAAAKEQAELKNAAKHAEQQRVSQGQALWRHYEQQRRKAFDENYSLPEGCQAPQSDRQFNECVNHKMRAKKEFFAAYQPPPSGAIPPHAATSLRHGDGS
ncbi:hypothetical protein [Parahalioglobus pacificus]|uniref:Uncharacterized protein n=1 Tax=Parahalioglobus pacificus TaxID=930806 RepID=A0A919CK48_9GAMM|nr:hypothetical protein [Halioglobus pacificus]GHD30036.1 hypothetical protein GCM10007053_11380 [Halioglobus pacificus]